MFCSVFRLKLPSKSVAVPILVPWIIMLAPGIASPVSASTTVPEIDVCAKTTFAASKSKAKSPVFNTFFVFIFFIFIGLEQSELEVPIRSMGGKSYYLFSKSNIIFGYIYRFLPIVHCKNLVEPTISLLKLLQKEHNFKKNW